MMREPAERRSEFRFPVVVTVEYFKPDDSGILTYTLDLSKNGTFISSDDPLSMGGRFGMHLTIPVGRESCKIFRTEGAVVWNRIQLFKSKSNGMAVQFIEPLPEILLLSVSAYSYRRMIKETEAKKALEERVEKLESELEVERDFSSLGQFNNSTADIADGWAVLCLFSATCEYCMEAADQLADLDDGSIGIYIAFHGEINEVERFRQDVGIEHIPWKLVDEKLFMNSINRDTPRVYLLKNGKVIAFWDNNFNPSSVLKITTISRRP